MNLFCPPLPCRYAKIAKEEGGTILCGFGSDPALNLADHLQNGYFFPPTVVSDLTQDSRCIREEIFGPIVCISKFSTEQEAIELANNVEYGLCASGITYRIIWISMMSNALQFFQCGQKMWDEFIV